MTKMIISFEYDNDVYFDEEDLMYSGVKYFHETEDMTISKVVEFIKEFYEATGLDGGGTEEEIFLKGAHTVSGDYVQEIINELDYIIDSETITLDEVVNDGLYLDVVDYLEYNLSGEDLDKLIDAVAKENDFSIGTVGYSQWADYLAHNNTSKEYVRSLWDGTNFYVMSLIDELNSYSDSVGRVYAEDMDELIEYTLEYFNISKEDGFKVVNNEIGKYIDMPKVEELREIKYSYKDIK